MRRPASRVLPLLTSALLALGGCTHRTTSLTDGAAGPDAGLPGADGGRGTRAVYVATAGVDTPHFVPVGGAGSSPRRIGPERGAGYGLGEATLVYRAAAPDGKRVLVVLQTREQQQLIYALATDGSTADAPVRIAAASSLELDLEISPDGSQVLYADGGVLYRARLSGEDASSPVRIATPPPGHQVRRPRWAPAAKRAVFELDRQAGDGQTAATIHSALLDGSEAKAPVALTTSTSGQDRAQAVLPDGRVIASLAAGVLWAIPASGGKAVRLGPAGLYTSLIAVIDGGARLVVSLAQGANWPRRLAVLATDGALADQPLYLTDPVEDLQAIVSSDGKTAAYVGRVAQSWAVFEVPAAGTPPPARVTAWLSSRPFLSSFTKSGSAILACSNSERTLLRIDRPGSSSSQPVVIATGPPSQPGCPGQMVLTDDQAQVLYNAHDSEGDWSSFRVPLQGGVPALLVKGSTGHLLPGGVVFFELGHRTSAIFALLPSGSPSRLTPWHPAAIGAAQLAGDAVTYRVEGTWYVVAADGRDREAPRRITPVGVGGEVLAVAHGRLTLRSEAKPTLLLSFALDGGDADAPVVLAEAPEAWALVDSHGLLLYAKGTSVHAVTTKSAGSAPVEVMKAVPGAHGLAFDRSNALAIAAVGERILAAPVDGSRSGSPIVVSRVGSELFALVVAQTRGRALITLATTDTAVPHPKAVLTARTDGQDASAAVPLAPPGFLLLATPQVGEQVPPGPTFTSGEESALLRGPKGLHAARVDGSEAATPRILLAGDSIELLPALPIAPDGRGWVARNGALQYFRLDGSIAPRALTLPLAHPVTKALWANGGQSVVFLADGALRIASITGTEAGTLTPKGVTAGALVGVDRAGSSVIFQTASGPDRSLMLVRADGSASALRPMTPIDDAMEELVGFLP